MKPVVFGSRGSALALAQSRQTMAALEKAQPGLKLDLRIIRTEGDRRSDTEGDESPLGKGLFTSELERALREGEIDLAVHSLKDLATAESEGVVIAAIPVRADARDLLISREAISLEALSHGATIATGSPRREAQLRAFRADLKLAPIRGNIDTRLRKLRENGDWDGMILAAAGLERLQPELADLKVSALPYDVMLPAPGQGALAVQARADDAEIIKLVACLHDASTAAEVNAEREFLRALGGGCQQPIAAYAAREGDELWLRGRAWLPGERRGSRRGPVTQAKEIGRALAEEFLR